MYCQNCGNPLPDTAIPAESAVEETALVVSSDVQIAKINAERDITLARINARMAENAIDVEQAAELAAAEAKADALESVLEPEQPAEPATIVINAPGDSQPEDDMAEPPPAVESGSEPPEARPKRSGYGSRAWFGG